MKVGLLPPAFPPTEAQKFPQLGRSGISFCTDCSVSLRVQIRADDFTVLKTESLISKHNDHFKCNDYYNNNLSYLCGAFQFIKHFCISPIIFHQQPFEKAGIVGVSILVFWRRKLSPNFPYENYSTGTQTQLWPQNYACPLTQIIHSINSFNNFVHHGVSVEHLLCTEKHFTLRAWHGGDVKMKGSH